MSTPGWGLSGWGDPLIQIHDRFDDLLTGFAAIYRKAGHSLNSYGIPSQLAVLVEDNVPCRLSTHGQGREIVDPKKVNLEFWKVFMRPRATYRVSETHFLRIEQREFEITSVIEPRDRWSAIHHLELFVLEIIPSDRIPSPV